MLLHDCIIIKTAPNDTKIICHYFDTPGLGEFLHYSRLADASQLLNEHAKFCSSWIKKPNGTFLTFFFPNTLKLPGRKSPPTKTAKIYFLGWLVCCCWFLSQVLFVYRNAHLNGKWLEFGDRKAALYIYFFSKFYSKKHNWAKVLNTHTHTHGKA